MKTFDEHLNTYLLDDPETGPEERRSIEAHVAGCADCRRSIESYRRARRLIAPQDIPLHSKDFVASVFSRVDAKPDGAFEPSKASPSSRRSWAWPSAAFAVLLAFVSIAYFAFKGPQASTQDLLAGGDGGAFYEWATTSDGTSDEDVLKVVLEGL